MQNTQNKFKVAAGIATFSGLLVFSVFISKPGLVDPNSVKANITGFDNVTISASDNDHTVGGITGADFTANWTASVTDNTGYAGFIIPTSDTNVSTGPVNNDELGYIMQHYDVFPSSTCDKSGDQGCPPVIFDPNAQTWTGQFNVASYSKDQQSVPLDDKTEYRICIATFKMGGGDNGGNTQQTQDSQSQMTENQSTGDSGSKQNNKNSPSEVKMNCSAGMTPSLFLDNNNPQNNEPTDPPAPPQNNNNQNNGGDNGGNNSQQQNNQGYNFAPSVMNVYPMSGSTATIIPMNYKTFGFRFNKPINPSSLTGNITLTSNGSPINGAVSYDDKNWIAYFISSDTLPKNSPITLTAGKYVSDSQGNTLENDFNVQYQTNDQSDNSAPTIKFTNPGDNSTFNPNQLVDTLQTNITVGFNKALDPTTITDSSWTAATVDGNGTPTPITFDPGSFNTYYDPISQSIQINFNNSLTPNTQYTFTFSGSTIKDAEGNQLGNDYVLHFITGAQNTTVPQVKYTDFTANEVSVAYSLPMVLQNVTDKTNYSLTCGGSSVDLTSNSINIYWDQGMKVARIHGFSPLSDSSSCTIGLTSNSNNANSIKATNNQYLDNSDLSHDGTVHKTTSIDDPSNHPSWMTQDEGCETIQQCPSIKAFSPINANPDVRIAGFPTNWMFTHPITKTLNNGDSIVLTFPAGFDISTASFNSTDLMNQDLNQGHDKTISLTSFNADPSTQTITLTIGIDGSGSVSADQFSYRINNIINPTNPGNYTITYATTKSTGEIIESGSFNSNNFTTGGVGSLTTSVLTKDSNTPIQGVKLMFDSPAFGHIEEVTDVNGQVNLTGIPVMTYGTSISMSLNGQNVPDGYIGDWQNDSVTLTNSSTSENKTFYLQSAPYQITGTINHDGVGSDGNTKVIVWASSNDGTGGWSNKPVTLSNTGSTNFTISVPKTGQFNVGLNTYMDPSTNTKKQSTFIMPTPQQISVTDPATPATPTFTLQAATKTIIGTVVDQDGKNIPNVWINITSDHSKNTSTQLSTGGGTDPNGQYTIPINTGDYIIEAQIPGISGKLTKSVTVKNTDSSVTVNFTVKKPNTSISGTVQDQNANPIKFANVNCFDNNGNFAWKNTDTDGTYQIFVDKGTWTCSAYAPNTGNINADIGVQTSGIAVTTSNITGINFKYDPNGFANVTGRVLTSSGDPVQNTWIGAETYNATTKQFAQFANGTTTASDGTFSLKLFKNSSDQRYRLNMFNGNGMNNLATNIDLNSGDVVLGDITLGAQRTVTITATGVPTGPGDVFVNLLNTTTQQNFGTKLTLTSGSGVANIDVTDGDYEVHMYVPGIGDNKQTMSVGKDQTNAATFDLSSIQTTPVTITAQAMGESGIQNVLIEASDPSNQRYVNGVTDTNGQVTLNLVTGATYSIRANKKGYISTSITTTGSTTSYRITLPKATSSISGTVSDQQSNTVAYVWVDAKTTDGKTWAGTMTDGNGNFTLDVNTGTNWNITARSPNGKYGSVTGKSAGATNVSIVLSQTRNDFIQKDPFAANVDATQPQSLTTSFAQVNADAGTFGSDTNTSVNMKKETSVPTTANKEAVAGIGVEVDATDSSNSSITTLQNNAVVHVTYDKAQIDASLQSGQINKASDLQNALLSYYDSVNSTWNTLNGNKLSIKVQATAGADYTVMDTDSFFADFTNQDKNDNDFILDWQGTTNHLTLFAPVISAAPTPVTPNNNQNNNQNNNNNQNQNPAPSFSGSSGSAGNTNDQTKPLPKTTTKTTPHFKGAADDSSYTTPAGSDYKNNFAEKYINRLFATKAVSGCSKNNFCPNNKITRAEFIKVLLNVMGTTIVKNQSVIFKDISTHWAKDYILTAAKLGIIKGYADGTFKPDLPVTRAEALKMVFSAFNSTLVKTTAKPVNNLADTDQSQWFYKYAVAATNNGMIKLASDGKGKTYLKPSQPLTRAEMAQLVIMVKDTTNTTTATTSNSTTQSATQQTIQTQNTK